MNQQKNSQNSQSLQRTETMSCPSAESSRQAMKDFRTEEIKSHERLHDEDEESDRSHPGEGEL